MSRKQDWTPRTKILGWIVVNMGHPAAVAGDEEGVAAVVASESGYVWNRYEDAEESARELRREFKNDYIHPVAVLWPGQVKASRGR